MKTDSATDIAFTENPRANTKPILVVASAMHLQPRAEGRCVDFRASPICFAQFGRRVPVDVPVSADSKNTDSTNHLAGVGYLLGA